MLDQNDVNATAADESVAQGQTSQPAFDPQQLAPIVNAQVEQKLNERLASLDAEVERRVQSALAKRENKANKVFNEDKRAIDRMAERQKWDDQRKAQELEEAWKTAHMTADAEPEPTPEPRINLQPPTPQPTYAPPTDPKRELETYVKNAYGLDASEFDVSPYAAITDANDPRVAQFQQAAVQKAYEKQQEAAKRQQNAAAVANTRQQYGQLGTPTSGGAPPPQNKIADIDDPDMLWEMAKNEITGPRPKAS